MILGNIDPGSLPPNVIRSATLISKLKSIKRRFARSRAIWDWALYPELPAAPCLSSRVETGIAIRPEVLKAIHAVEQSIAKDFPTRNRSLQGPREGRD